MGYFDVICEQDWGIEDHRNEGIEICFQETGASSLVVDGKRHATQAGTLSITRPWQLHSLGNPHLGPGRLHWIIVDVGIRRPNQSWTWPDWCILTDDDRAKLTQALRGTENPIWKANKEIGRIFSKLGSYLNNDQPTAHLSRIKITLNQLFIALLDLMRDQNIIPDESLSSPLKTGELFLKELQRDPRILTFPWTLDSMAEHCGIGRTTFANICHDITNTSPIDFLNRSRLEYAAQRLSQESKTAITTIAMDLGYATSQYFSRKFKERYQKTPREWRATSANKA